MYTYLSSHAYIIRYTNKTYVLFQMLQVSLQHCRWVSYQIAEQVTIVNLLAFLGSWGIVLHNDLESNRQPGRGEGTQSMKVTTYAPPLWHPPFQACGKPSAQHNRITHNLAAHHLAAHNPAARLCACSAVCNLPRQQCALAQRWPNDGTIVPTLGRH